MYRQAEAGPPVVWPPTTLCDTFVGDTRHTGAALYLQCVALLGPPWALKATTTAARPCGHNPNTQDPTPQTPTPAPPCVKSSEKHVNKAACGW